MKKYSAFFGAVLLFTYTTVAVNIADADLIQPVSYDMLNGQASTYSYWDESYSGSGDPTENYSPLSGGLGDLTDGIIATENWYIVEAPDGPGPYVGWRIDPITITFHFEGAPTINEVTIYVDDANGEGGVKPPRGVEIAMGGTTLEFPVINPPGSAPISVTFSDLNLTGESLDLTLVRRGWVMLSEVTFDGNIEVDLDIKPGSDDNPINLKSKGVIPVAILGSDDFDVSDVHVSTVTFGPNGATPAHEGGHLEDVNDDGRTDLVLHFNTQDAGLSEGDTTAEIAGATNGGTPIKGADDIRIVGKKAKKPTVGAEAASWGEIKKQMQ